MTERKVPTDRKEKEIPEFAPAFYIIEGEKYPSIDKLFFVHVEKIEKETGTNPAELSPMMSLGVTAWLCMNAVVPSVSWDSFKNTVAIDSIIIEDSKGRTPEQFAATYPKV
jgi:hypothetical protein